MSCGLTICPDMVIGGPDCSGPLDTNASGIGVGFMQVMPTEFEREELQDIRDRARRLSIQGSPAKTVEERLYQELADVADQLDAFAARFEAEVEDAFGGEVTVTPMVEFPHRRPFLGGHKKPR